LIRHAAANAKVPCLMATPSLLLRKYIGESNYQVRALFSLISKLSPCILFIDEIDGLFQERNAEEHHVLREIKTEFLQYWDGLLSNKSVLVVGATNRPFDLDAAALRRLPIYWYIDPPNASTRRKIWKHWLEQVPFESDVDIDKLIEMTDGYTPSDIRHVLQVAALEGPLGGLKPSDKISFDDLLAALSTVAGSRSSDLYSRQLYNFMQKHDGGMFRNSIVAWETSAGRFYSLGTWNIDGEAIRTIMDIVRELQDADGSEDEVDDMDDDDL
jgi:ATPase family AAA domain-containing protein 1